MRSSPLARGRLSRDGLGEPEHPVRVVAALDRDEPGQVLAVVGGRPVRQRRVDEVLVGLGRAAPARGTSRPASRARPRPRAGCPARSRWSRCPSGTPGSRCANAVAAGSTRLIAPPQANSVTPAPPGLELPGQRSSHRTAVSIPAPGSGPRGTATWTRTCRTARCGRARPGRPGSCGPRSPGATARPRPAPAPAARPARSAGPEEQAQAATPPLRGPAGGRPAAGSRPSPTRQDSVSGAVVIRSHRRHRGSRRPATARPARTPRRGRPGWRARCSGC